jgi:hypothetical protein
MTVATVRMPMPSVSRVSSTAAETTGSTNGASRPAASAMVTRVPSRANICAISRPTAVPPITSMDPGSSVSSNSVIKVRYPACSSPPAGGICGAASAVIR